MQEGEVEIGGTQIKSIRHRLLPPITHPRLHIDKVSGPHRPIPF